VRHVLAERDFWGLAVTLLVVYTARPLPHARKLQKLMSRAGTWSSACSYALQVVDTMRADFDAWTDAHRPDRALTAGVRDLAFAAMSTVVIDAQGDLGTRRVHFEAALAPAG
jgi:hypothetical protein